MIDQDEVAPAVIALAEGESLHTCAPRYVCGFLFSQDLSNVALIRKRKPEWMRNKLNGIGGQIELGETWLQAMAREFKEEAGLGVEQWQRFNVECYPNGVRVHYCCALGEPLKCRSLTDETVIVQDVRAGIAPFASVYNLPYLIPMAQIFLRQPEHQRPVVSIIP